jgi:hypothetical protein
MRNPSIAGLPIFALDRRPGDAMGDLLLFGRPSVGIFGPGVVEGASICAILAMAES